LARLEQSDIAASQPAKVKELLQRLSVYGASTDQVPPTIFWPFDPSNDGHLGKGVAAWNYQCPQCKHSGALLDAQGRRHWDPWCDDVQCGVGPPAPAPPPPPPPTPVAPTAQCPVVWRGGISNPDLWQGKTASWEGCCAKCAGYTNHTSSCAAWTWFQDGLCHLHSSDAGKNTNRHPLPVSGTMTQLQRPPREDSSHYVWWGFGT
jgi:hypothetical protein